MYDKSSRLPGGDASPGCACGALARPSRPGITEQHASECPLLDTSRARRERDLADLAQRPDGWVVVRAVADGERGEVEDATGCPVPASRRARRRWSVLVTRHRVGGRDVLARRFTRDGEVRGLIVDESPAPATAGAR